MLVELRGGFQDNDEGGRPFPDTYCGPVELGRMFGLFSQFEYGSQCR